MKITSPTQINLSFIRNKHSASLLVAITVCIFANSPIALASGIACAYLLGPPTWALKWAKQILAISVVGLGAGMSLQSVIAVGSTGMLTSAATLGVCLGAGFMISKWLRIDPQVAGLITVGTAICGGSAIAAVAPLLDSKPSDIATSLGVVFVLNAIALLVFPAIGISLGMDASHFGQWCAFAIHDTSSVVGAASVHGPQALEIATITKLSRALWILPVGMVICAIRRRSSDSIAKPARIPVFMWAFLMVVALFSFFPSIQPVGQEISLLARKTMVLALFFVGLSLDPKKMGVATLKPLLFGSLLWILLATGTLYYFC